MRIRLVFFLLGRLVVALGCTMLLPLACSLYYGDGDVNAFLYSIIVTIVVGLLMIICFRSKTTEGMRQRESFMFATFAWVLAGALGCLPYLFSGVCLTFPDAFFETVSGFTTTGASVLTFLEGQPRGILLWRSLTQWLGGMGIVVLFVALLFGNHSSGGGTSLYKAEAPGNSLAERLSPRVGTTSKILWIVYVILTLILIVLLKCGGMTFYDAVNHAFATMSTGGFGTKNNSMGYYDSSAFLQWITILFMFLAGSNIAFFYSSFVKRQNLFWRSEEFRTYLYIAVGATVLISASLFYFNQFPGLGIEYTIRQAAFQTVSVLTTTGFASADFNFWPSFTQVLLFMLLFCGGMSGSTSGAIKVCRIIAAFKSGIAELIKMVQPKAVVAVRMNNKVIQLSVLQNTVQFIVVYFLIFVIGSLILAATGLGFTEALSAAATCLGNVGPGLGLLGPASNFSIVSDLGKVTLSILMILGRLELYTVLVLLVPSVWRK